MKSSILFIPVIIFSIALSYSFATVQAASPDNTHALQDVNSGKTVFDVNVGKADKLLTYLTVISKTYDDLVASGVASDFVIAFRGASVRLLTTETWSFEDDDQKSLKRVLGVLKELKTKGVRLEVCSVATKLYHVDNSTILPPLTLVGNTFVSLIGYQNKGYALIPIH